MSLLRVSIPGQSPRHVNLGPSVGRISHTKGVIAGWSIAPTMTLPTDETGEVRRDPRVAGKRAK